MKLISFVGTALDDLRRFPDLARRRAGFQLDRVQRGLDPDDWWPMASIGAGVREIRVRDAVGAYRVVYVANIGAAIHVLHAFEKRTQRTATSDLDLAMRRYRQLAGV